MSVVELVLLNSSICWTNIFLTTTVNFLKFVHKILLYVEMKVVELVILNTVEPS